MRSRLLELCLNVYTENPLQVTQISLKFELIVLICWYLICVF